MTWLASILRRRPEAPRLPDRETLDGWLRAGYEHSLRGERTEAAELYHKLLEHDPADPDALYFLAILALGDGRELEAAELLARAVEARPNDASLWSAFGLALFQTMRAEEAAHALRAGLAIRPADAGMRSNLAAALIDLTRGDEARVEMERLLDSGIESAQLRYNVGHVYRDQARIDDAMVACWRAVELSPDDVTAFTNYLLTLNYSENCDAATLFAEHRRFGARFARPYLEPEIDATWPRRLRVGYVSPDFRSHVVANFVAPILDHHDRSRFEIFCYHSHRREDHVTERLRAMAEHWLQCVHMSDLELAQRVRDDRIDILVDLTGHTGDNRLLLFAHKPAPVQMSYLGYPNTTGLAAIDYRVSDERADPPSEDRFSVEQILRPWPTYFCFRPPTDSPELGPPPAPARGQITFGSFNYLPKVSGVFLAACARVLAAVPNSRLVLKSRALSVAHVAARLRDRFVQAGIDPARVELRGWEATPKSHLEVYGSIDIALDTFPYNGATTTCEALWMGVPVVSVKGDRHAGRMGSSILHAVGLQDLLAVDVDGYVATAVRLASDLDGLAKLRAGMRERMRRSPVMDETGFVRALESCYLEAWEKKVRPDDSAGKLTDAAATQFLRQAAELRAAKKMLEAEEMCKKVLLERADHAEALALLWDLSYDTGHHGVAVEWLRRGIAVNDGDARLHYMMGYSLIGQQNYPDAAAALRKAIALEPSMAKGHNNLGCALEAMGDVAQARECYRAALERDPQLHDAVYNLGNAHRQLGELDQAIRYIGQATRSGIRRPDWNCNLGDLLLQQLRLDEAAQSYSAAIGFDPDYVPALMGRAAVYQELGRLEESEADLRSAMRRLPDEPQLRSQWLLALHYRQAEDRPALFEEHREWSRRHRRGSGWQAARAPRERRPARRLNIGYVSPDFKRHSVAAFFEQVLGAHDRGRFKIFCYANSPGEDEVTRRLRGLAEEWRDISRQGDDWVAERICADRIDILVDLAGHTTGGRMSLFALKPAPVQATWLGYPDTTGLAAIDYRLTDAIADPPGEAERFHVEALVRLPQGFLCYGPPAEAPEVAAPPSLANGHVTFGSCNRLAKLTPAMIALWSRILGEVRGARLMLKSFGLAAESARREVLAAFASHGIGAERIDLRGPEESFPAHLEKYGQIDIALDTFPYNGAATTCEALWMGVPVVSRAGTAHASRVGASILGHVGLGDLVADSAEAYAQKAVALARDGERLRSLRATLRERMAASPLLDATGFARALESAYAGMWDRWCEKEEAADKVLKLNIGGTKIFPGWKILNVQAGPGVDYVGDCTDLSRFADGSVEEIYASHVLEHVEMPRLKETLIGFHRILKQGGTARISVPDFAQLCRMFLDPRYSTEQRFEIMTLVFGGQADAHDAHHVGLDFDFLRDFLVDAGFSRVERVEQLGLMDDMSTYRFANTPVSLNVIAYK